MLHQSIKFKRESKMFPYNNCENKWLSKSAKKVSKHYREYQPMYELIIGIGLLILFILTLLTTLSSFL